MGEAWHRYFDIYGNEKKDAWRKLIEHREGAPEDSGLTYPDYSWWANPNLVSGVEYDLLMLWLTEPAWLSAPKVSGLKPLGARIQAFRSLNVTHSRSVGYIQKTEKRTQTVGEDYFDIVEHYEPLVLGDEYVSWDDADSTMKNISSHRTGLFFNIYTVPELSPFRYRIQNFNRPTTRYFVWVDVKGKKERAEVPYLLYKCLTVGDHTLLEVERWKRVIKGRFTNIKRWEDISLDEAKENLVESYEKLLEQKTHHKIKDKE